MRYYFLVLAMLCLYLSGTAQERTPARFKINTKGLTIGDPVPDVHLEPLLNYPTPTARLSDFKGKWLIIDLYATWCTACLTIMPKLQALQEKYADKLQVLVVTYEHDSIFQKVRARNKVLRSINLPFLTGDSVLHQLFPHREIPHEVWIDPEGVVRAITSADDVREENVAALLSGKPVALRLKKDLVGYRSKDPLPTGDSGFLYRSLLTKKVGTGGSYIEWGEGNQTIKRMLCPNNDVTRLYYQAAFNGYYGHLLNKQLIELETGEKDQWIKPSRFPTGKYVTPSDWAAEHAYSYELILPAFAPKKEAYAFMLQDLNRFFPVKGGLEKRKRACWVIYNPKESADSFASQKGTYKMILGANAIVHKAQHAPFDNLVRVLNQNRLDMAPILNETGYHGPVTMELNLAVNNTDLSIPTLKKALNRYGLDIKKADRMVDVLVIRDK